MSSQQNVTLRAVTRADVSRIADWLEDERLVSGWFGSYSYGERAYEGYRHDSSEHAADDKFASEIEDPSHVARSIYTDAGDHVGEVEIGLDEDLGDGQLSVLVGRPDLWRRAGADAIRAALDMAFNDYGLYRVWVSIPDGSVSARSILERVGFIHEGTLRAGGDGHSAVLGILAAEYKRE